MSASENNIVRPLIIEENGTTPNGGGQVTSKMSSFSSEDTRHPKQPSDEEGKKHAGIEPDTRGGLHSGNHSPIRKVTRAPTIPPDTPESRVKKPSTMDRYLEDQYEHWVHRPLTTFGMTANDESPLGITMPIAHSRTLSRKISITHEESESEEEKRTLMAKIIPFSAVTGKEKISPRRDSHNKRRRVVDKGGDPNIQYKNISKRRRKYFSDLYTTLVDCSWLESLFLFSASFYITWLFFAVVYYIICYIHGDLDEANLPKNQDSSKWKPCVWEIEDFASCFLFSLETQHTIGYGSRQTTNECTSAMIAMSLQSIIGCLIQAFMVGLVFAKLSRPQSRSKTVVFSKQAVVCERNRKLCMIFRIGDMRHDSFIVNASLSIKVIRRRVTEEGEMYHDVVPLKVKPDSSEEPCVFLIWPITVIHVIDQESPFYRLNAHDLANDKFELHMVLEGVTESTSMTFQARTSYLPHEILWGHRFEPMMLYRRDHNKYQVNFSAFHSTYEVDTPVCSSYELEQYYKRFNPKTHPSMRPSVLRQTPAVNNVTAPAGHNPNMTATASSSGSESAEDEAEL